MSYALHSLAMTFVSSNLAILQKRESFEVDISVSLLSLAMTSVSSNLVISKKGEF